MLFRINKIAHFEKWGTMRQTVKKSVIKGFKHFEIEVIYNIRTTSNKIL